ncbi:unnamed protein product [Cuscuta campestris]|uniref:RNase H type-1 domain-containing protein n=1 Tax=Cuscuta campestris TaxID=132261 RepID=A0A484M373_9ASTE|nr:unnamed protein product [Cuscuta campestris]
MAGRRTRRNAAASAQSTVRSDNPEQGMIVPVNGLETALNNVANMMANIMERLDKALPGPSGTRDVPAGQPRQVLRTASSPILQELHDPEEVERERQAVARRQVEELARNTKASQVASSNREPRERTGRGGSQAPVRSLVVLDEDEVQSQVRVPAPQRLGPPIPEAGEFQDLRQQIQEMQRKINRGRVFTTWTNTALAPEIFAEPYPQGFKMPFVRRYDGESDPQKHINSYVQVMIVVDASDALMCRCFLQIVDSKRKESREVEGTDDKSMLAMFTAALQDGLLHTDLTTHPPDTFEEAMVRAGRYVTLEERKEEKKEKTPKEEEKARNKKPFKNKKQSFPDGPKGTSPGISEKHKSANPKVCNVEDTGKWCAYHRKNDHNTEDCYTLKNEMARLIRRGHLKKFVQDGDARNPGNTQNGKRRDKEVAQAETQEKRHIGLEDEEEDSEPAPHRQKRHHVCNFIIGGNTGGDSATSRKKWANAAMVNKVLVPEGKKLKTEPIVFSNADLPETWVPHRDALVIMIDIMDLLIHKTLVDTGSSVNIMYMDTYKALGLTRDALSPIKTPLTGFTGDSIEPEGVITLPVEIEDTKATRKLDMEFVVVGIISNTNIILGRPRLEDLECVISPHCAISTVMVRDENGVQHPVYYVSKTLRDAELRPRPSIKGQALTDFQVECTAREMTRAQADIRVEDNWWVMSIDGSLGSRSCGAGIVLITMENFQIYYAIRFQFRVSNNEAKYEALINGLRILGKLGVSRVQVYSDSRLVVGQITREFEAKEERMKRYRDLSLEILGRFEFKLEHIPRAQNAEADVLSKLSAESLEYISKLATVEEMATPSLNRDEMFWVSADPPEWLDRLAKYIEDGVAPEDPQEARLLRMRVPTYKIHDGVLYKRSYNGVLLCCLRAAEAKAYVLHIRVHTLFPEGRLSRDIFGQR